VQLPSSQVSGPDIGQQPVAARRLFALKAAISALLLLVACASPEPAPVVDQEVYRRAEVERAERLETEIERLRADLRRAEEALVLAESGLRGSYTRADAVSTLAESRIEVERTAALAPWRSEDVEAARKKLDEANSQIRQDHFGAAFFFIYRAQRMAEAIKREADFVAQRPETRFIKGRRVNLRAGPSMTARVVQVLQVGMPVFPESTQEAWMLVRATSGAVGWIHQSLLRTE
jgi:SH3-like domain-containing protein